MKLNKITFGILALSIAAMPAMADEMMDHSKMDHSAHEGTAPTLVDPIDAASSAQIVTAKVNGLVCDFCAQAVRYVFKKQDAV